MGSKGFSSSLAILATFLLLSTAVAGPRKLPAAKRGDKWQEIMTKKITAAMEKAMAGKSMAYGVGAMLPGDLDPRAKKDIGSICKQAFDTLIGEFRYSLADVKKNDTSELVRHIASVSFFECQFALEETRLSLDEVNGFDEKLKGLKKDLLTKLKKIKPEVQIVF